MSAGNNILKHLRESEQIDHKSSTTATFFSFPKNKQNKKKRKKMLVMYQT